MAPFPLSGGANAFASGAWNPLGVIGNCQRGHLGRQHRPQSTAEGAVTGGASTTPDRPFLKAAVTAGCLALTGDTIAQVVERTKRSKLAANKKPCCQGKAAVEEEDQPGVFWGHDFLRSLRMASYGFLLYGPGSKLWYNALDSWLPGASPVNFASKVLLNQVLLGPVVLLVVFSWNMSWMGKARELPNKFKRDFVPTLIYGWKFWVPASAVNFGVIPLQHRVLWMSSCAVFWNFYLSATVAKK